MINFHFTELSKFINQINKSNNESNKNKLTHTKKKTLVIFHKNPNDKYFRNNKTPHVFKIAREKLN